ncbi:GntR family transcriptional regulator [Streptomyces sp. MUM 178J]|uniref:GntR family transcriptional regulator n=1 Tax=Streptomyces sp. MUM 178J TaxID=2791991 RepID=UPI001F03982A|nr:GntR family transcriptional regulator [Streptomyces sp. MUM 178J]WRQ78011.1 GntR family transcriptional regulator [Streptomyces sp. MUM 178J]
MTASGRLSISVSHGVHVPPYEQVRAQLAELIATGGLGRGDRLPSVRQLASDLGLANNTVVRAYRELETAGLVRTRRGSGTRVIALPDADDAKARLAEHALSYALAVRRLDATDEEALAAIRHALATQPPSG